MNRRIALRTAAYLALFLFFTFIFILTNYPAERLTNQVGGWISSTTDGALAVGTVRFKPPVAIKAEKLTLKTGQQGSVDLGTAVVRPRLLGFLSGKRGADVRLENQWLDSDLTFVSTDGGWDLDVESARIDLSMLPDQFMTLPILLEGEVMVSMKLASNDESRGVLSGDVTLTSGAIEIGGDLLETLGFSPLKISRVQVIATVEDNVLTIGENSMEGYLNAVARGTIRFVPSDYMASRLDLNLEIRPGAGQRERMIPIFTLLGARTRADGSINLRVRGTAGKPAVTM